MRRIAALALALAGALAYGTTANHSQRAQHSEQQAVVCVDATTDKLNGQIAATPDGGTLDLAGATWQLGCPVVLAHPVTVTNGTLRFDTLGPSAPPRYPKNRTHVQITGDDAALTQVLIDGPNSAGVYDPAVEFQHGVHVTGDRALVAAIDVREVHGDGVKVSGGAAGTVVEDSEFSVIGRQGASFGDSTDTLYQRNRLRDVARSAIDVEPLGKLANGVWTIREEVHDLTVHANVIGPGITNAVVANLGGGYVEGWVVTDNQAIGEVFTFVARSATQPDGSVERRREYTITGNGSDTIYRGTSGAVSLAGLDDVVLADHHQPVAASRTGPALWLRVVDTLLLYG